MTTNDNDAATATVQPEKLEARFAEFRERFAAMQTELQRAIVGYEEMLQDVLVAIVSHGHVLLEGVPGLGKTYLVRMLARALGVQFGRVQCTPDLMPADILGTHIVNEDSSGHRAFSFEKGPVFTNLLLVDEINRATPKTQAALLEVMQEEHVTVGGETFSLPRPFFVMATQNPLEMEGTYPLPEAQLDRFFYKLKVPYPSQAELVEISRRTTGAQEPELDVSMQGEELIAFQDLLKHVPVADPLASYAAALVLASHPEEKDGPVADVKRFVSYGASPRGMQTLIRAARVHCVLDGRTAVSIADIQRVAKPALRHRILLNFEGEAEAVDVDGVIDQMLKGVPTPAGDAA
ncbi:MAG: MoxR family ATPase [Planctomycetota bacterium]|nr:MoxR family ATPase [Planctomycetota bacterium]